MKHYKYIYIITLICFSCNQEEVPTDGTNVDINKTKHLKNEPLLIKISPVSYGNFSMEVVSNGKTAASNTCEVKFPVSEKITAINVKNGDDVLKGQVLATLDQTDLTRKLLKSKNDLDKSAIDLNDRLIDYGLNIKDSARIPLKIMQIAKIKSGYNSALFDYTEAQITLKKTSISAPFSGKIANLEAKPYNMSDGFKKLCDIIDDRKIQVNFNILETEYAYVKLGATIEVKTYEGKRSLIGHITQINPLIDENGMIKITGDVENATSFLLDGMNVKIYIKKDVPDEIFIPKQAIIQRQNRNVVFVYDHHRAHWQYVETGIENSTHITILSGLKKGQQVIVSNVINLANNSEVIVNRTE